MFQQEAESEGVQQPESGAVQPNVSPSSQQQAESGDVQLQPNVSPSLQQPAESGGVQVLPNVSPSTQQQAESNLGGSAHQLTEPEIEPEISGGGVQPNANLGRSAHQQRLNKAQIAANKAQIAAYEAQIAAYESESEIEPESEHESEPEIWTVKHFNYYRTLFKAAQSGDWKTAKSFIDSDPDALTANISESGRTVLHIAAHSCQWKFILMLLELDVWTPQSIAVKNIEGSTVLHIIAEGGNLKTAKALVEKNPNVLQMVDNKGYLPLASAICSKNKELVWYLSLNTTVESPSILRNLIQAGYHDIALYFVQRFPHLALAKDEHRHSLLTWLANNPSYFFSGCNLGFFERRIYKIVRAEIQSAYSLALQSITQGTILGWFKGLLWKAITQLAPSIKIVRDAKMTHECAIQLVIHVVNQIELSTMSYSQILDFLLNPASIENGIEEIVRTLVTHFPDLMFMWATRQPNMLQVAIACRQENIVSIIKENSTKTISALCSTDLENSTALHLAAKLAPAFKLFSVSGAALQIQREWQWFKEVEMYTPPDMIGRKDSKGRTAKDVFRLEHEKLCTDGEKWMKDTANSCMLVSTIIATALFAAAFTVPGGNDNDKGIPIFLRSKAFTVFVISNALGLFSSLTSLLMFLAIQTARYDIEDFHESLPKKLIICLGSVFFALAAMMITFGAALTIILGERWHWVSLPITLLASFPVAMFVMLELPSFVQMVRSTYGASIFRPLPSRV